MINARILKKKIIGFEGERRYRLDSVIMDNIPDIADYECNTYIPLFFYNEYGENIYISENYTLKKSLRLSSFKDLLSDSNMRHYAFTEEGVVKFEIVIGRKALFLVSNDCVLVPLALLCVDKLSLIHSVCYTFVVNRELLQTLTNNPYYSSLKRLIKTYSAIYDTVFTSDIKRLCFSFIPRIEYKSISELNNQLISISENVMAVEFPHLSPAVQDTEAVETIESSENIEFSESIIPEVSLETVQEAIEETIQETIQESTQEFSEVPLDEGTQPGFDNYII